MARPACLDQASRKKIELMVKEKISCIGGMDLPVSNNLITYCEALGIPIIQAPGSSSEENSTPQFSALYHLSRTGGETPHFIGLNTADYFTGSYLHYHMNCIIIFILLYLVVNTGFACLMISLIKMILRQISLPRDSCFLLAG